MDGPLLVPNQDVADAVLFEERVVDRQHGAARVAEDDVDTLIGQRFDHHFGARHGCRAHRPKPSFTRNRGLRPSRRPAPRPD
jgi:hypothetical protein